MNGQSNAPGNDGVTFSPRLAEALMTSRICWTPHSVRAFGFPRTSGGAVEPAKVTVTPSSGATISGKLEYRDEFTIALTDSAGWYHAWPVRQVKVTIDDPVSAHVEQLNKYTDKDMHDVLAYLQTLK